MAVTFSNAFEAMLTANSSDYRKALEIIRRQVRSVKLTRRLRAITNFVHEAYVGVDAGPAARVLFDYWMEDHELDAAEIECDRWDDAGCKPELVMACRLALRSIREVPEPERLNDMHPGRFEPSPGGLYYLPPGMEFAPDPVPELKFRARMWEEPIVHFYALLRTSGRNTGLLSRQPLRGQ